MSNETESSFSLLHYKPVCNNFSGLSKKKLKHF